VPDATLSGNRLAIVSCFFGSFHQFVPRTIRDYCSVARFRGDHSEELGICWCFLGSDGAWRLNHLIREMVAMLHDEANRNSVTMRTELSEPFPHVMADRVQLQQVFMNLILNGIEAMCDTTGELIIKSQMAEGGQLLFSVSDTGVGLPTGKSDEIFRAFFTTKPQGTGLGLAITRSIVESHGGRVWATENDGRGATFQFTLPQRRATHA
jgi:signal transduction histidine kinase